MSANHNNRDGFSYGPYGKLNLLEEAMFSSLFDEQVDLDEQEILYEVEEAKFLKRVCIVKTLLYPMEWLLTRIFLGKAWTVEKVLTQKLYWKFLRNKISLSDFKDELFVIVNNPPLEDNK